jgi:hypothetical protein
MAAHYGPTYLGSVQGLSGYLHVGGALIGGLHGEQHLYRDDAGRIVITSEPPELVELNAIRDEFTRERAENAIQKLRSDPHVGLELE